MFIIEITAVIFALSGTYFLENKTFEYRLLSNLFFLVANILTSFVAISYNLYGILTLQILFTYMLLLGLQTLNNDLKEIENKHLLEYFLDIDFNLTKILNFFCVNFFTDYVIKLTFYLLLGFSFFLVSNETTFNYITTNLIEIIGVTLAIFGSYTINKGYHMKKRYIENSSNLIAGIFFGFIVGDALLFYVAYNNNMFPFAFQTFIFILLSFKNLYKINNELNNTNIVKVLFKDYLPNCHHYFKNS